MTDGVVKHPIVLDPKGEQRRRDMKVLRLGLAIAAMSALVAPSAATAGANPWPNGFPSGPAGGGGGGSFHGGGFHGGFHGARGGFGFPFFYYSSPEVVHDVVVVHDQPDEPPPPPPPPPPPREAWVLGKSYSSLPAGCMKMIQSGSSYYHCSGEWYRQVGGAYRAVEAPL
jgi:hypothetical protein